jgi:hypothetical protein
MRNTNVFCISSAKHERPEPRRNHSYRPCGDEQNSGKGGKEARRDESVCESFTRLEDRTPAASRIQRQTHQLPRAGNLPAQMRQRERPCGFAGRALLLTEPEVYCPLHHRTDSPFPVFRVGTAQEYSFLSCMILLENRRKIDQLDSDVR